MKEFSLLRFFLCLLAFALALLSGALCRQSSVSSADPDFACGQGRNILLFDDFQAGVISPLHWITTFNNDFKEKAIDVFDAEKRGMGDFRLRFLANTLETNDETVKFLGVRSVRKMDFTESKELSFVLDWNDQPNGSYLTAGVYLCPALTDATPSDEGDWIKFEYVGVPPGRNARFQVVRRTEGNLRVLFDEGWPDKQRTGRKIEEVAVKIIVDRSALKVFENRTEIFSTADHGLNFSGGYLYLEMSSHSNYPARTVTFDNICVGSAAE